MNLEPMIERIRASCQPLEPKPVALEPRLKPLAGIRAVLFDIYGTLFISAAGDIGVATLGDSDQAMARALESLGLPPFGRAGSVKQAIEQMHVILRIRGIDCPEVDIVRIWWQVLAQSLPYVPVSEAQVRQLALEYELRNNPVWPMPGAASVLVSLKGRGLRLGLVSNAQFYTPLMFPAFFGKSLTDLGFDPDFCLFSYQAGEAKPCRRLFELARNALAKKGVEARQVLYVGNDMLNDIWPAQQVGMRTALFAGDARSLRLRETDSRCRGLEPDLIIKRLGDILAVLA